jgi:hypothetical protein
MAGTSNGWLMGEDRRNSTMTRNAGHVLGVLHLGQFVRRC